MSDEEANNWAAEHVNRLFRDGKQWCAVGHHFDNLAKDHAGFGDTPLDAIKDLMRVRAGAPGVHAAVGEYGKRGYAGMSMLSENDTIEELKILSDKIDLLARKLGNGTKVSASQALTYIDEKIAGLDAEIALLKRQLRGEETRFLKVSGEKPAEPTVYEIKEELEKLLAMFINSSDFKQKINQVLTVELQDAISEARTQLFPHTAADLTSVSVIQNALHMLQEKRTDQSLEQKVEEYRSLKNKTSSVATMPVPASREDEFKKITGIEFRLIENTDERSIMEYSWAVVGPWSAIAPPRNQNLVWKGLIWDDIVFDDRGRALCKERHQGVSMMLMAQKIYNNITTRINITDAAPTEKWLREMAAKENNGIVSVGGLVSKLAEPQWTDQHEDVWQAYRAGDQDRSYFSAALDQMLKLDWARFGSIGKPRGPEVLHLMDKGIEARTVYCGGTWTDEDPKKTKEGITSYGKRQIPPDLLAGIEADVAKKNKKLEPADDAEDQDDTTDLYESDEKGNPELDSRYGTDDDPRIPKE